MAHGPGLRKTLAEKFDDELKFFKGWIDKPKAVGSIVPTSSITARKMASVVNPMSGLPVLEVGPGTGVITRAILAHGVKPENLYAVEYSPDFVRHLRQLYPGVNVIEGDAFNLDATLGDKSGLTFDSVISGVPLLNFPVEQRVAYVESLLDRIPTGRPVVQLTYGPLSPIPPGRGDYTVEHFHFVIRNIPPTQLWIYRRGAH
ncbi:MULTISPECIES: phospholipid N-methyltransferase PmtA [Mesorhizobium]|jgi:phosphatidylethanolamine/phosphatidyl-N-methylethanolamine N-methyltransferase|uniref:Phosphatidylethanolamine N-methyltransferase /phosphatidyl-N-methylethanolamine N-methyltransferase n=1 Tax=Mesorhizobium muleiense TaxID=1004279 RepID=A0A1G8NQM4_9HYPH|nr:MULTISPECIES: class I SAM-dependent methyltransferase [Mesorhizobium]MCF6098079.1 class I SAM-dependent methyltransferase [Mesorhizobium muleiense]MCF6109617.1 class I SAM-dependent methyltransferase [Mesorhizobium muleiense]MCF6121162.1 class I SAM-dependent methyltransferase [Mesorhizobium muleiense]RWA98624.1 MAG: methyltransferase domain-containing protein [Mesorhizobium sp.]RWN64169.1 MAG: methyltransferase domain-containing protein [Mesorhizobium sp.]